MKINVWNVNPKLIKYHFKMLNVSVTSNTSNKIKKVSIAIKLVKLVMNKIKKIV